MELCTIRTSPSSSKLEGAAPFFDDLLGLFEVNGARLSFPLIFSLASTHVRSLQEL